MRGPASVMAMVCSECAVFDPSAERRVQPSASMTRRSLPSAHHGSSAKVMPGRSSNPRPCRPRLEMWGSSCMVRPNP